MTVYITWTTGTGATNQTVQYKTTGSSVWTDYVIFNDNVTSSANVTLPNGDYDFRVINNCTNCNCLSGYTQVGNTCVITETTAATSTGSFTEVTRTPFRDYGGNGTRLYTSANNNGSFTLLDTSNPFWIRTPPSDIIAWNNLTAQEKQDYDLNNGPVNRLSVWGKSVDSNGVVINNYTRVGTQGVPPVSQWIGFDVCINISSTKTYYISIAGDNFYRISIDGVVVVQSNTVITDNFTFLHIYPSIINAGSHTIRVEGYNDGSAAGFGCEIYDLDNRPAGMSIVDYLNAQTNYNNLTVLFTTRNATSFTSNLFTCPSGYTQINPTCNEVICSRTTTVPCVPNNASNIATINNPTPTYYYYQGVICGGSTQVAFRSTESNLADSGSIVKVFCAACSNTQQCFDNISTTTTVNTNDLIAIYPDCVECYALT